MQIFEQEKGCGPEQLFFQYCSILVLVSVWIVICFLECWSLLSWMCQSTSHPAALVEQCCDNDCTISGFRENVLKPNLIVCEILIISVFMRRIFEVVLLRFFFKLLLILCNVSLF